MKPSKTPACLPASVPACLNERTTRLSG